MYEFSKRDPMVASAEQPVAAPSAGASGACRPPPLHCMSVCDLRCWWLQRPHAPPVGDALRRVARTLRTTLVLAPQHRWQRTRMAGAARVVVAVVVRPTMRRLRPVISVMTVMRMMACMVVMRVARQGASYVGTGDLRNELGLFRGDGRVNITYRSTFFNQRAHTHTHTHTHTPAPRILSHH